MCVIDRQLAIKATVMTAIRYQGFILNLRTSGASLGLLHLSHKRTG